MSITRSSLALPDAEIYYETRGSGPALLCVHAGIANLRMWEPQAAALADRYQVVALDMRGFGRTRSQPGPFSARADLAAVLDALAIERATVMGCSMGGMLALDFALERPQRVRGLVWVCSAFSGYDPDASLFSAEEIAIWEAGEAAFKAGDYEAAAEHEVRLWVDGPLQPAGRAPAAVRDAVRALIVENYRHAHVEGLQPTPLEPPAAGRLAELRMPVLAVVGDLDPASTADAARLLAASAPDVRVAHFPDAAHMPSMEHPDRFNALLAEFLATI